jgi:hypothetical protein
MDWLLIACAGLMAWVTLCVVAGERTRREQVARVRQMEAERQAILAARAEAERRAQAILSGGGATADVVAVAQEVKPQPAAANSSPKRAAA